MRLRGMGGDSIPFPEMLKALIASKTSVVYHPAALVLFAMTLACQS